MISTINTIRTQIISENINIGGQNMQKILRLCTSDS